MSDPVLYTSEDGRTRLQLRIEDGTAWLTQSDIAELFDTTKQNVSLHIKNILQDGELASASVVKDSLTTAADGKNYQTKTYNLDLILAVGYRVRSPRGVQFRRWASTHLKEYLVKGYVMDDERLKDPGAHDHFDELLARIRDIRASEKRFYQKVRDLFALSSDYGIREKETSQFFAQTQNKLLYAATGSTAAELIVARSDPNADHMGLTNWHGDRVRKQDVIVAKNYLRADEIDTLNRLTVIFLEQAELRVKNRRDLTLGFWQQSVDTMLDTNGFPVLKGAGEVSHNKMKAVTASRYEAFDADRRAADAASAEAEDLRQIEELERKLKKKPSA